MVLLYIDFSVYALDGQTGELKWSYATGKLRLTCIRISQIISFKLMFFFLNKKKKKKRLGTSNALALLIHTLIMTDTDFLVIDTQTFIFSISDYYGTSH